MKVSVHPMVTTSAVRGSKIAGSFSTTARLRRPIGRELAKCRHISCSIDPFDTQYYPISQYLGKYAECLRDTTIKIFECQDVALTSSNPKLHVSILLLVLALQHKSLLPQQTALRKEGTLGCICKLCSFESVFRQSLL